LFPSHDRAAIKDLMGDNGLLVIHAIEVIDGNEYLKTRIVHAESGESVESVCKVMLTKHTAQEYGSYITYMRRYSLSAMLGLVTDEDDDANAAVKAQQKPEQKKAVEKKLTPEQEKVKQFIEELKDGINDCPAAEDINYLIRQNVDAISKLTEAQQKYINDFAANRQAQLSQAS
jgi:vacuolar-type H+-ATPase subunit I/STV1